MFKNLLGNVLSAIVDAVFVYSAYMSASVFSTIWDNCGVTAEISKSTCFMVMAAGSAICMSWVRRLFKD